MHTLVFNDNTNIYIYIYIYIYIIYYNNYIKCLAGKQNESVTAFENDDDIIT